MEFSRGTCGPGSLELEQRLVARFLCWDAPRWRVWRFLRQATPHKKTKTGGSLKKLESCHPWVPCVCVCVCVCVFRSLGRLRLPSTGAIRVFLFQPSLGTSGESRDPGRSGNRTCQTGMRRTTPPRRWTSAASTSCESSPGTFPRIFAPLFDSRAP